MQLQLLASLAGPLALALPIAAQGEVGPNDFRISSMGVDGVVQQTAADPAIAYNPVDREYLVVWGGEDEGDGHWKIYGQRIDALTGAEIGVDDFPISGGPSAWEPAVAYNPVDHEYLVVWYGSDSLQPLGTEIYGQRLGASTGAEVGADDFRISSMGPEGDDDFYARYPAVAHDATLDRYLVVWDGNDDVPFNFEIWGQLIDGATGAEVGPDDLPISDMGPAGVAWFSARYADVVWNPTLDVFAVVWQGNNDLPGLSSAEEEIYGQAIDPATGAEVGPNDFRISAAGPDGNPAFFAQEASIAYNPVDGEYLVVWTGGWEASLLDSRAEIYAQRIDAATGAEVGVDDMLISALGLGEGDPDYNAFEPDVAFTPYSHEYVVTFAGIDPPQVKADIEVFVQRIDGATGAEIGPDDQRISDMGPDGKAGYPATGPALALAPEVGRILVVWEGADGPPLAKSESEIFGQQLAFCPTALPSTETVRAGSPPNPVALLFGVTSGPVLGATWDPVINHASFEPGAVLDGLGIMLSPINVPLPPLGTLLCDPAGLLTVQMVPPGVPFAVPVPNECSLVGLGVCAQGASADAAGAIHLTNALDVTLGTI